ncbi:MAG: cytochrome o ubiquinol oxidase subunit IV [Gammaproteobacteria bacterium]|nr:cytochrome o ubiquinol oxidase subunit IV [Gammaproteobacteria bacterium]
MANHTETQPSFHLKTLPAYILGFFLSLLLTFMAFGVVVLRVFTDTSLYLSLGLFALAQLMVQSICFLRLNTNAEGRWNLLPFLFTLLIILIFVTGSLWIMSSLNYNMLH